MVIVLLLSTGTSCSNSLLSVQTSWLSWTSTRCITLPLVVTGLILWLLVVTILGNFLLSVQASWLPFVSTRCITSPVVVTVLVFWLLVATILGDFLLSVETSWLSLTPSQCIILLLVVTVLRSWLMKLTLSYIFGRCGGNCSLLSHELALFLLSSFLSFLFSTRNFLISWFLLIFKGPIPFPLPFFGEGGMRGWRGGRGDGGGWGAPQPISRLYQTPSQITRLRKFTQSWGFHHYWSFVGFWSCDLGWPYCQGGLR